MKKVSYTDNCRIILTWYNFGSYVKDWVEFKAIVNQLSSVLLDYEFFETEKIISYIYISHWTKRGWAGV